MLQTRRPLFLSVAATFVLGCTPSTLSPSNAAVEKSALGEKKCVAEGDETKLFLVEWDATDLSSFEAKAGRDLVFVKYDQCQMKVLHGCSDDGIAGRYGSYKAPELTSGSLEALSIKTEDELYAKLPLGAASFGSELKLGKVLELKYQVSGTRYSSRDQVYLADLSDNPRCAGATHFVASYNLGAFTLSSTDSTKAGAGANVGNFAAGAKHSDEASALKRGGDIAACSTFDRHACRVPIRVLLRPVAAGARPPNAPGSAAGADTAASVATAEAAIQAMKLRLSAEQKLLAGDAQGCLTDLERAKAANPAIADAEANMLRGKCEMRAGRCDEGKKHYREAKAAWTRAFDKIGLQTDATLDAEAEQVALQLCPSAAGGGVSVQMAAIALLQKIVQAQGARDVASCIQHGKELEKLVAGGAATDPDDKRAAAGLRASAICAADGGKCAEGKQLWTAFSKHFFEKADAQTVTSSWRENVKSCKN